MSARDEPITATKIRRAQVIMRDPLHPEYPQWAKDRDARLAAATDKVLAPLLAALCSVIDRVVDPAAITPEQRAALDRAKRGTFNTPIAPRASLNDGERIVPRHSRVVRR